MTKSLEQQLAQQAAGGDHAALARLLELFERRVYNLCLRMLHHRDDAAEAAQDTLVKVIEHLPSFENRSEIGTWIYRIGMNQCLTRLRQRQNRPTVSLDAMGGSHASHASGQPHAPSVAGKHPGAGAGAGVDRELSPAQRVERDELLGLLQVALARLDEAFRSVLVLRDLEGMDYQQISQVLQLPEGTVKSRLFRARLALRHEMLQLAPAPGTPPGAAPGSSQGSSQGHAGAGQQDDERASRARIG